MIVFTVVEGKRLLPSISQAKNLKKEYKQFSAITHIFSAIFFIISALRTLFVFTVLVALFQNENDLLKSWNSGYGFIGLGAYFLLSIIDLMRLLDLGIIIAAIWGMFTIGNGFGENFLTYLLPIIFAYVISILLVVGLNFLYNAIIEKLCPHTYGRISEYMEAIGINKKSPHIIRSKTAKIKKASVEKGAGQKVFSYSVIAIAIIMLVVCAVVAFQGGLFEKKYDFCKENSSAFSSYDSCTSVNSETKVNTVCAHNPGYTYTFHDDEGEEKTLGCQDIKNLGYPYDDYVVNPDNYSFEVVEDMVYEVDSSPEILAGYRTGKYCTSGQALYTFSQSKACAVILEISKYECTNDYCALVYNAKDDIPTYIIFENYNKNSEDIFRIRYNKPMSVYGNIAPFKKGVVVRVYDDNQIQNRVEAPNAHIRCSRYYKDDLSKCDYFKR